jgi:hypothetical protein
VKQDNIQVNQYRCIPSRGQQDNRYSPSASAATKEMWSPTCMWLNTSLKCLDINQSRKLKTTALVLIRLHCIQTSNIKHQRSKDMFGSIQHHDPSMYVHSVVGTGRCTMSTTTMHILITEFTYNGLVWCWATIICACRETTSRCTGWREKALSSSTAP